MTQPSCYICPMPIVEQSCVLRESPERLWNILSDLRNWSYLFSTRTWLRRIKPSFELLEGTGADMSFQVSYGWSFREKWMMTQWRPPEYLAAAGRSFLYRCPLHDAGLAFALAAIGPLETRVDCCLELEPFPPPPPGQDAARVLRGKGDAQPVSGVLGALDGTAGTRISRRPCGTSSSARANDARLHALRVRRKRSTPPRRPTPPWRCWPMRQPRRRVASPI